MKKALNETVITYSRFLKRLAMISLVLATKAILKRLRFFILAGFTLPFILSSLRKFVYRVVII